MIELALLGKNEILEKIGWCKKFSANQADGEVNADTLFNIEQNIDVLTALSSPVLDEQKIGPKFQELGLNLPENEDFELFTGVMVKEFKLFGGFTMLELVPGRPDYEFGLGWTIETHNIFFEDKVYKEVEKVLVKKKMGFLKEKVVKKEKKIKTIAEIFGNDVTPTNCQLSVTNKEKDNRGQMRYGLSIASNVRRVAGQCMPEEMKIRWKDEEGFFQALAAECRVISEVLSAVYLAVGYEAAPNFSLLVGEIAMDRKIAGFQCEQKEPIAVINTQYS